MTPELNRYGDQLIPSGTSGYGAEISTQREDKLDRQALRNAKELVDKTRGSRPVVYDIGCGKGAMARKFCDLGCAVIACDIQPMPKLIRFAQEFKESAIRIIQADARSVNWDSLPIPQIVYSQRFLHYIPFPDAVALIRSLTLRETCTTYLSMSGLQSELGANYTKSQLHARFDYLDKKMAIKHAIDQPICLYGLNDARKLAQECNLEIVRLWLSEFGNPKLIAKR